MTSTIQTLRADAPVRCPLCAGGDAGLEMPWKEYRLLRCRACDLVYADHREVPAALYDDAYDHHTFYQGYFAQAKQAKNQRIHVAWAWRHFFRMILARGSLLDVGCATGGFMTAAAARGWQTHGLDVSPVAAQLAAELTGSPVKVGTLESCAFPNASFDAVTAWEVLEHVQEPRAFLAEINRILKPGGVVAISTPNWRSPWERATTDDNRRPPFHLTYWTRSTITRLLSGEGFGQVSTREKPIAWREEVGGKKWVYLPVAIVRSLLFDQKGNRLFALGTKLSA